MSRSDRTSMLGSLASLVPEEDLIRTARAVGALKRERKKNLPALVWTLVLGFSAGRERRLAALHRTYEAAADGSVAWSTFYDWFTASLVSLMKEVLGTVMTRVTRTTNDLGGIFAKLPEVVATDAMVIRLHDALESLYPGCRTNHTKAAAKLHLIVTVVGASPTKIQITSERTRDEAALKIGPWVAGRLLLFDLGYYKFQLFDRIDRNKGWFISRAKTNFNPTIVALNRAWRGRSVPLVGEKLQDVLGRLKREVLDVMVEVRFDRRPYAGSQTRATRTFRVVGVRDPSDGDYHIYITNVPVEVLTPEEVSQVYAARWSVELIFRELTLHHRAKDVATSNKHIVHAMIYGSLLSLLVSRKLAECLKARLDNEERERLNHERVAVVYAQYSNQILMLLVAPHYWHQLSSKELEEVILHQVRDPHRSRRLLRRRVADGRQIQHMTAARRAA